MQALATDTRTRSEAQQIQSRRLQLSAARYDLARYTRDLYRASDRGDRTRTRKFEGLVARAQADIAEAEEQLAELGALL